MSVVICFLCTKANNSNCSFYENIESYKMPASQKSISAVLQHLGNLIETKLIFHKGAIVCFDCFEELKEYDALMVNLLCKQNKLRKQLEESLRNWEKGFSVDPEDVDLTEIIEDISFKTDDEAEGISLTNKIESTSDKDESSTKKRPRQLCLICNEEFRSKYQLINHMTEAHGNRSEHTCKICGVTRRDEEYLELHMNVHEGKSENECRYCPKKFSRPVNTLRHMRLHWDRKKYQCEKCGERFSLDNMLYNHKLRHEAEENPIVCEVCNQSFRSRKTYNHHAIVHQENRPRHQCPDCPKSFTERYTLKIHHKTNHEAVESTEVLKQTSDSDVRKEQEPDLEVVYMEPEDMNVAVETVETSEMCVICNTCFDSKKLLETHLETEHDVILNKLVLTKYFNYTNK